MTNQDTPGSALVDVAKTTEGPFRNAVDQMTRVSEAMKQRNNQIAALGRAVTTMETEKLVLQANVTSLSHENDQLRARLAAVETEYADYQRRAVTFVQFVETRCAEFVDQDHRVEGAFLYQDASRSLGEELRAPSTRFAQFRESFASPARREPVLAAPHRQSILGDKFHTLYSETDLG